MHLFDVVFVGLFVRLTRAVRCNITLGNALLMFSIPDNDVLPPHTVLGRAVVPLSVLGPLYLREPLETLDMSDPKLVRILAFSFICCWVRFPKTSNSFVWVAG